MSPEGWIVAMVTAGPVAGFALGLMFAALWRADR